MIELRNKHDLIEYFEQLDPIEKSALLLEFAECLYGQGCINVAYEVPEEYLEDENEPEALTVFWVSTNRDVVKAVKEDYHYLEER